MKIGSLFKLKPGSTKKEKGYTLLEVLLYSIILGLFLLLVSQVFISVKLVNAHSIALASLQRNFRQIVSELDASLKRANNVTTPVAGESSSVLALNDGLILYQLSNGILEKVDNGQAWDLSTNEVVITDLSFGNLVEATQTATIEIRMTAESNYLLEGGRKLSEILKISVSLR
jgi:hypothetical protein